MRHSRIVIVLTLLNCLAFISGLCNAGGVYKWVDDNGVVHYGDRPNTTEAQEVKIDPAPEVDPAAEEKLRQQRQQLLSNRHTIKRNGREETVSTKELDEHLRGKWNDFKDALSGKSTPTER